MDKSEKTNSLLAIIGLAADIVGLVTFISSYSSAPSSSLSNTEPSSFFYIISAFIIFYGWIALGYVFSVVVSSKLMQDSRCAPIHDCSDQ